MTPSPRARIVARRTGLAAVATLLATVLSGIGVAPASATGTASISGVVTNTRGEPLPGSSVRLLLPDGDSMLKVLARVDADEDGAYTFPGLAAGDYGIHAYGPSGTEYVGETWDDAVSWHEPTVITLVEGEARTGIDLRLALGGVVRGVVTDSAGAPLPGILVSLLREKSGTQTDVSTHTDEQGAYEIRRLVPGTYRATFWPPTPGDPDDPGYVKLQSDPFQVDGDAVVDHDASLTRASVIAGTVTDPHGSPVKFLNVTLHALRDGTWSEVADAITSWDDRTLGRYAFRGLEPGTYALWFWSSRDDDYPQEWWNDKPDRASSDLIELVPGTSVTADVRLEAGARIQGTLTDEAGVPVTGQWARLSLDWGGAPVYVAKRWVRADGTYEFDRLRSGSYTIEFGGPDFVGEWWEDAPDQQSASRIEVVEGETISGVDAQLARSVSLSTPIVSGSASVGSTLTVEAASATPDATIAYEWFAAGSPLLDASSTSLELRAAQLGTAITVRVTATAPGLAPVSKESKPTGAVVAGTLSTSQPTIGGSAITGSTLSANPGSWTSGTSFAYQWFASGVTIKGATGSTLELASAHAGSTITVQVTGTQPGYLAASTTSAPTPKVTFPGLDRDFSGDEHPDVLVRTSNGAMLMYAGDGASGWQGASTIGSGWTLMNHVFAAGDFSGDGREDVIARDSAGRLHLYRGDGGGGWLGSSVVGAGWGHMTAIFSPGDFSGDGNVDVLARDGVGNLWLYPGDGKGGWGAVSKVGAGWNMFDRVFAAGSFGGRGGADVMGRTPSGELWVYPTSGSGGWSAPARVGTGWGLFDAVFGSGDFDGDGFDDVMGRDRSGRLWLYPGRGGTEWGSPAVVGTGWGRLSFVI